MPRSSVQGKEADRHTGGLRLPAGDHLAANGHVWQGRAKRASLRTAAVNRAVTPSILVRSRRADTSFGVPAG
jgi:hypothetical protein